MKLPVLPPVVPRAMHFDETAWNSTEAIRRATTDALAKGLLVRQVLGAKRNPAGVFVVSLVVTGPIR